MHVVYRCSYKMSRHNSAENWISVLPPADLLKWEDLVQISSAGPPRVCTSAELASAWCHAWWHPWSHTWPAFIAEITCYYGVWVSTKVSETHFQQMPRVGCTSGECFFLLGSCVIFFHLYQCNMETHRYLINLLCYLLQRVSVQAPNCINTAGMQ